MTSSSPCTPSTRCDLPAPPQSWQELEERFADPKVCEDYLAGLKWPKSLLCPRCLRRHAPADSRRGSKAKCCPYRATVTGDTLFQDSDLVLPVWFQIIWRFLHCTTTLPLEEFRHLMGASTLDPVEHLLGRLKMALKDPGLGPVSRWVAFNGYPLPGQDERSRPYSVYLAGEVKNGEVLSIRCQRQRTCLGLASFIERNVTSEGTLVYTRCQEAATARYDRPYRILTTEATHGPTAGALSALDRFAKGLQQRLAGPTRLWAPEVDLLLELHVFQHNNRRLTPGKLFQKFMLHAVRSLKGRVWPPLPVREAKVADGYRGFDVSDWVCDPEEVLRTSKARYDELFDPRRVWKSYLKSKGRTALNDMLMKQALFPGSTKPRNVRRRAKRAMERRQRQSLATKARM